MDKLVIFDLDGTLLNTIDDICDSLNLALADAGLTTSTVEECKYYVGSGVDQLISRAIKGSGDFNFVKEKYMQYYQELQNNKTRPYDGVVELINKIKQMGLKVAILSNKPHDDALRVVDNYFGLELFDLVLGKKPENRIKPDIDGCLEILDTLKINKQNVLYVGDTNVDMQTALNSGFTSVAVSWGFRKISELENYNYIINEALDLIQIIEEWK
jgi:phosphoglycolate phosphatase